MSRGGRHRSEAGSPAVGRQQERRLGSHGVPGGEMRPTPDTQEKRDGTTGLAETRYDYFNCGER